jgi:polygalacturonase
LEQSVSTLNDNKVDKRTGYSLVQDTEITKLAGIEAGANKTIVDTALSKTSTNPVENKVIAVKIEAIESDISSKNDALTQAVESLSSTKADKTAMENADKALQAAIQACAAAFRPKLYNAP